MHLDSLIVKNLRNLQSVDLSLNPRFNVFYGANGSGKTSLLEAIHVLTTGRSFRAHNGRQFISFGKEATMISGGATRMEGELKSSIRLGLERSQNGNVRIRLAEQDCHSIAELAKTLPIQLINSESYAILEASPQFRRQFLDWIMFHVEHSFYPVWRRFKRALQQRNAALKNAKFLPSSSITVWDAELAEAGEVIHQLRREVITQFTPIFSEVVSRLLNLNRTINIHYDCGWKENLSFQEALTACLDKDRAWGYTTVGPQRADLDFLLDNVTAKNVLSRGQTKLFICALIIARAILLFEKEKKHCIFLIDDINAELDNNATKLLIKELTKLNSQIMITSIEADYISNLLNDCGLSLFHVEHGTISTPSLLPEAL